MHNLSYRQVEFETGDGIGQIVFQKAEYTSFDEVSDFNDIVAERNQQRFGSTEAKER